MITTVCKISYGSQTVPPIVPAVQGDTGRAISFEIADFTPPAGATATYFILKPSGEAIYNSATITDNSILCELTAQSLAEAGENRMQVRVLQGEDIVTSFEVILMVRTFLGDDAIESGTEMNIFDQAVEQAAEEFQTQAEQIVEEVIESIPSDYTALTEEVDELNERIGDVFSDEAKQLLISILKKATYLSDVETLIDDLETAILSGIITIGPRGVIEINNAKAGLPIALTLDVLPIQDLNGYGYPWAEGNGKNICKYFPSYSNNGITMTTVADGGVSVSGTATATVLNGAQGINFDKECVYYMAGDSNVSGWALSLRNSAGNTVTDNGVVFGQANPNNSPTRIYSINDLTNMQYLVRVGNGATPTGTLYPLIIKEGENNKLKGLFETGESGGLSFTVAENDVVTVSGTAQDVVEYDKSITLPAGDYVMSGNRGGIAIAVYNADKSERIILTGERGGRFSLPSETVVVASIHCAAGTYSSKTVVPVICEAILDTEYAPYSNICPFTSILNIAMKHGASASNYSTETFDVSQDNYYGGKIDFVNAKMTKATYYASYAGETLQGEWLSSMDKYTQGGTPTIGAEVVNIGSQAELTKTINQITLLDGNNRLWSDNGNTTLTYEKRVV